MARHLEAFRFAFLAVGFAGCTALTKVDWSLIPPPEAMAGTAGIAGTGGGLVDGGAPMIEAGGATEGGSPAAGEGGNPAGGEGLAGEGGFGGELGGAPPDVGGSAGLGGTSGGGTGGGGTGGVGGGGTGGVGGGGAGGSAGGGIGGTGGAGIVCATYPTPPATVNLVGKIVVFDGGASPTGGNFDGRAGADTKCQAVNVQLALNKTTVRALLASAQNQALKSGQADTFTQTFSVPIAPVVVSPMGILMGSSFDEFIRAPKTTFICGGVVREDAPYWYSGVTQNGDYSQTLSCYDWKLGDVDPNNVDLKGGVGRTDTTANAFRNSWISDHPVACLNQAHLLCVGWD